MYFRTELLIFICFLILTACHGQGQKKQISVVDFKQQKVDGMRVPDKDSIRQENFTGEHLITYAQDEAFDNKIIPVILYATIDTTDNSGNIDSLVLTYDSIKHNINLECVDLYLIDPSWLEWADFIRLDDFNFDNHPDVAIYDRGLSGNNNRIYQIFIYNPAKKQYLYHEGLSNMAEVSTNAETETILSFWASGAGRFEFSKYKWNKGNLMLIYSSNQDYDDSLDIAIRKTDSLHSGAWVTRIDTLIISR
jgi:hypothetical protein